MNCKQRFQVQQTKPKIEPDIFFSLRVSRLNPLTVWLRLSWCATLAAQSRSDKKGKKLKLSFRSIRLPRVTSSDKIGRVNKSSKAKARKRLSDSSRRCFVALQVQHWSIAEPPQTFVSSDSKWICRVFTLLFYNMSRESARWCVDIVYVAASTQIINVNSQLSRVAGL